MIVVGGAELAIVDAASAPARSAMDAYFAELAQRFPGGFDPGDALDEAATAFNPPMGVFVLALADGQTVGCGATQFLDAHTAEVMNTISSPSRSTQTGATCAEPSARTTPSLAVLAGGPSTNPRHHPLGASV